MFEIEPEYDIRKIMWGSNGKSGKEPLVIKPLIELETDHLENILKNVKHIRGTYVELAVRALLEC